MNKTFLTTVTKSRVTDFQLWEIIHILVIICNKYLCFRCVFYVLNWRTVFIVMNAILY